MADSAKDPKEERRKELEQKLSKNKSEIEEILDFIQKGKTGEILQKEVEEAFSLVEEHAQGKIFHEHKSGRVPISHHSSRLLHLIGRMEELFKIGQYGADLHKALSVKCRHRVRMLLQMREL